MHGAFFPNRFRYDRGLCCRLAKGRSEVRRCATKQGARPTPNGLRKKGEVIQSPQSLPRTTTAYGTCCQSRWAEWRQDRSLFFAVPRLLWQLIWPRCRSQVCVFKFAATLTSATSAHMRRRRDILYSISTILMRQLQDRWNGI